MFVITYTRKRLGYIEPTTHSRECRALSLFAAKKAASRYASEHRLRNSDTVTLSVSKEGVVLARASRAWSGQRWQWRSADGD